ncbi:PT domain-containing protein, partial [Burkholderia multivorans]|nr:PT domain-containing protein [Burkholderia multivorans]
NPPTHQPTNPPTHQPTNPPTHQPTNPPTHQPTNPPTHPLPPRFPAPNPRAALCFPKPCVAHSFPRRTEPHSPNAPPRVIHNFCGKPCGKSAGWPGRAARGLACL